MRRRIGFGILLVVVGIGLLVVMAGGYTWNWTELWPALLILLGLLDIVENGWRGLRGGGGFLILVGGFILLFTLQVVPWPLRQVWPAGLILLGLLSLLGDRPSLPWAIILIGGGGFLLAVTTGRLGGDWRQFWPVILILAGLVALVGRDEEPREEPRVPMAVNAAQPQNPDTVQEERLRVLDRVQRGEITVEEGVIILEGLKGRPRGRR